MLPSPPLHKVDFVVYPNRYYNYPCDHVIKHFVFFRNIPGILIVIHYFFLNDSEETNSLVGQ